MSDSATRSMEDMRVVSLKDSASIAGISIATLRRRIDAGDGPPVVRMSPRRVGIRAGKLRKWLEAR
ncbi:helix-turn-helix transcriptional regulator [Xanthobacter sediminis]